MEFLPSSTTRWTAPCATRVASAPAEPGPELMASGAQSATRFTDVKRTFPKLPPDQQHSCWTATAASQPVLRALRRPGFPGDPFIALQGHAAAHPSPATWTETLYHRRPLPEQRSHA